MAGHHYGSDGKCTVGDCKESRNDEVPHTGWVDRDESSSPSSSSSCFIATAVYGDVMAPEVISLRAFRDQVLKKYWVGQKFIQLYYKVSPPVADWLRHKPRLSMVVRAILNTFLRTLK